MVRFQSSHDSYAGATLALLRKNQASLFAISSERFVLENIVLIMQVWYVLYRTFSSPLQNLYKVKKTDPGTVLDVFLGPTYGVPGGRATDSPTE